VGDDGHIMVKEVGGVMAAMGYSPSAAWLRSVVTEVDRTGVGNVTINFQTFLELVLQRRNSGENSASGGNVSGPLIVTNVNRVDMLFTLLLASLSVSVTNLYGMKHILAFLLLRTYCLIHSATPDPCLHLSKSSMNGRYFRIIC
jgi:hypothetical protein